MFQGYDLNEVTLLTSDFCKRRNLVKEYLKEFDIERLMHTFKTNAGIPSQAEPLGGWEEPDCGLRGHFVGHFLSSCVKFAYGDNDDVLRSKALSIVEVMKICAQENGYVSAFPEKVLDELEKEENRNIWAPYYTLHKILQGLVDCANYLKNTDALTLAVNLALYIRNRFQKLSYWKINGILQCTKINPANEFGGIGDALYQLYRLTNDERILETAKIFDRDYFIENLYQGNDILEDLHANTHLPMILAAMQRYELTGEQKYRIASENFYTFLSGRTFANGNSSSRASHPIPGGVSETAEHWGAFQKLSDALTGGESESCCAHNTEKIAEKLFLWTNDTKYLDHIERLKYNAVLNSASSITGLSQYHQPLGTKMRKKFSTKYDSFWCCTGSGIEAMSELQKNIWFHSENTALINMFVPSCLHWKDKGIRIIQSTDYPNAADAQYTLQVQKPTRFRLAWKKDRIRSIKYNGKSILLQQDSNYIYIEQTFQNNDRVEVTLQSALHIEPLQDSSEKIALLYDNVLLATTADSAVPADIQQKSAQIPDRWIPLYQLEEEEYSVYINLDGSVRSALHSAKVKDGRHAY